MHPHISLRRDWPGWAMVLALVCAQVWLLAVWPEKRPAVRDGVLVVAAAHSEMVRTTLSPYGPGLETDLVEAFCRANGLTPRWLFVDSWEEGWELLRTGKADVLVGPGLSPPPGVNGDRIRSGPRYAPSEVVILNTTDKYPLKTPKQLCDVPLILQNVQTLPTILNEYLEPRGCTFGPSMTTSPGMREMLALLQSPEARFGVAEARLFQLWQPFVPEVEPTARTGARIFRRWHWRTDTAYDESLALFWRDHGTALSAELKELYFGFFPVGYDAYEMIRLRQTVRDQMQFYREAIITAAKTNRIDPLLLAALIYQESRFDRHAQSPTGVRGLMQISQETADHLGMKDRTDPFESIEAGARYLRFLYDSLEDEGLPPWHRWFVALAAYNQGLGRTRAVLARTADRQLEPLGTAEDEALSMLGWETRGRRAEAAYNGRNQAGAFVRRVRLFYYILTGLSVLPGNEAEHLAPFAAALPPGWPRT
ncbi:Lytic transglycosylase catalytic [Alkalidesulfovibrio alkalitolerans DSM 16529]|uniref:Lytic transglycosylase catalytic n=1 Tax=Alkalidesulfovibrio alkalitolerans DSM 16529 TaxID=1121439 RepID=S7UVA6_9BACT|nr:transglycosylase SLT domain-containing protein [Alkalidesulfovibrio alkalitolerans]EPR36278.1 Lytic transglycosylase catalytic [Alkalidesulfovibrio alkalitolerans DSM 16529]